MLFLTRAAHNSRATERPVALGFPIELESRSLEVLVLIGDEENLSE